MIEQSQSVSFTTAKLGREIENGGGLDFDAGKPPNCSCCQFGQILSKEGTVEEPLWFLIISGCAIVANVVEMNCKF